MRRLNGAPNVPDAAQRTGVGVNSDPDRRWLREAIQASRSCPPSRTAYSVGAVIVDEHGRERSRGFSRDLDPLAHAEQAAILRLGENRGDLSRATIYTSMEPCTTRRSAPLTCAEMIIRARLGRVVLALREPPLFARCLGIETLRNAGIEVVTIPDLGAEVTAINAAVLAPGGG
jgi:diaminohydroxyphosphoribosylaminopyrimidine deaminase/5-amino-6-(5-phosphoribosylamino)uracil reductase